MAAVLSARAYRILVSVSFAGWGGLLLVFFYSGAFEFATKREDFLSLIETTAGLSALALAVLAFLHEMGSRDRYLKLALASLTLVFLLATTTGLLTTLTFPANEGFRALRFRFLVVGLVYVGVAVSGVAVIRLAPFTRVPLEKMAKVQTAYDYSVFLVPVSAFALWSRDTSLAAVTITLSLGGLVLLLCSVAVLLIAVWRQRTHEEDLQERVLETLRNVRERHQQGGEHPEPVSLAYLRSRLLSNEETLLDAIEGLRAEDRLVQVDYHEYYILEDSDWDRCAREISAHSAFLLGGKTDDKPWDDIVTELVQRLHLPRQVHSQVFHRKNHRIHKNTLSEYRHD